MVDFNFLLPPGSFPIEGGHAYIQGLATALTTSGHGVWFGDGPDTALRVIDGMAIPTVAADQLEGSVGLIHHPTALAEGDLHDEVRERLPLLRRLVATSDAVRDRLVAEFGVDPAAVTVIRPGVPDVSRSTGSGTAQCTILSVGALVPRKGHAVLLRALDRLFDLPWRLVLVGDDTRDPAHAASLRAQAAGSRCGDRVRFAGSLATAELAAEWQQADLFALATEWKGYSAPVAEALRRGLPVAVTAEGQAAELVTPEVGVVCPPGDADQLSKAMRRLIFDAALRDDMADAAWHLGRTLPDWPSQAARFVDAAQCC